MKKNKIFKITLITIIALISIIGIAFIMGIIINKPYTFELDSENKYTIITDSKWKTLQNDGGSHVNIYYQIDLDNSIISKVQEIYQANLGGKPNTKKDIQYIKRIDSKTKEEATALLEDILTKENIDETYNAYSFEIKTQKEEKEIYDKSVINTINEFLTKVDELKKQTR